MSRKIGMWLYSNGGGDKIQKSIVKKLKDRGIETVSVKSSSSIQVIVLTTGSFFRSVL